MQLFRAIQEVPAGTGMDTGLKYDISRSRTTEPPLKPSGDEPRPVRATMTAVRLAGLIAARAMCFHHLQVQSRPAATAHTY